ncbi:MAG: GIY-YIG nuclease family protein [Bacteroidales bacterium]|nr:GIY-YIG nuclease family protein [Bacteroidales bacterium]
MASKTYSIDIDGYWREANIGGIPSKSGVYFVYECTYNTTNKTVSLKKLIYIGESDNVNDRIKNHEKWDDWRKHVGIGNELCFSFGEVSSNEKNRVEAAYIFKHKPPVNTEYVNSFPYDQTTIKSTGKTDLLFTNFTVYRT